MSGPTAPNVASPSYKLADAIAHIPPDQKLPAALVAQLSPRALNAIADNRVRWARFGDTLYVKRKIAQALGGYAQSMQIKLEETELDAIASGAVKLVSLVSIFRRLFRLSIEQHPFKGTAPRIREPSHMYGPGRRPRGHPRTVKTELVAEA